MSGHFTYQEKKLLNVIASNHKCKADSQALLKI